MSRSYLKLGLSPSISNLAVLRIAIRRLHPDTLAVRSFQEARKRYYRELLDAHAVARAAADVLLGRARASEGRLVDPFWRDLAKSVLGQAQAA